MFDKICAYNLILITDTDLLIQLSGSSHIFLSLIFNTLRENWNLKIWWRLFWSQYHNECCLCHVGHQTMDLAGKNKNYES